ncbi:DNA-deoxyinosine glycosylase [Methylobacillus arboreus]|uniref:DNA-deoxyinosine glycosylase n=1 Tax=Methylobacillus arboreus TaxID=755170 RepID=UPI001E3D65C9|nr:DNA-deoxyinosine glycosylase [Methylobacillus arboreus]MCB5190700.1 DNA-deoxyinosine glycosylase [Methylobacillus arboreus]
MLIHSFPPAITPNCRILILGSMPGKRSLEMQAYYAHQQNLFWPFINHLFNIPADTAYQQRLQLLNQQNIGIWDVLKECIRISSLDGDIEEASIIANDFSALLVQFPHIRHIFFNGSKAEQAFRRHVLKQQSIPAHLHYHKLPSTSPANASITRDNKFAQWQRLAEIASQ